MSRILYQCVGECRRKFVGLQPAEARAAIGRGVECCGRAAQFVRVATPDEAEKAERGQDIEPPRPIEQRWRSRPPYRRARGGW